ncbi:phosphoribosylanthranilate isomerase [Planctomycetota bacterium]
MPTGNTRIKVCCVRSRAEALLAIRAGVDAIGLVSAMPSGPGVISEEVIADVCRCVPPGVSSFLLTSSQEAEEIVAQQRRTGASVLQLVDHQAPETLREVRRALPGIRLVQVIHVAGEESLAQAMDVQPFVDGLLFDSGRPNAPTKELGGTGRTHDWNVSRSIVSESSVPVFLAGGLNASNVERAIFAVQPFGVDVCSGVRTDGRLDAEKLRSFVRAVRWHEAGEDAGRARAPQAANEPL